MFCTLQNPCLKEEELPSYTWGSSRKQRGCRTNQAKPQLFLTCREGHVIEILVHVCVKDKGCPHLGGGLGGSDLVWVWGSICSSVSSVQLIVARWGLLKTALSPHIHTPAGLCSQKRCCLLLSYDKGGLLRKQLLPVCKGTSVLTLSTSQLSHRSCLSIFFPPEAWSALYTQRGAWLPDLSLPCQSADWQQGAVKSEAVA